MDQPRRETALILTMARGDSLALWHARGLLSREAPLLAKLSERFERVLLVSHGDARDLNPDLLAPSRAESDPDTADTADPLAALAPKLTVIPANLRQGGPNQPTPPRLEARVDGALAPGQPVLIQTLEFDDGGLAERIVEGQERSERHVTLVARGRAVSSRRLAAAHGPHSAGAVEAGMIEQELCRAARLVIATSRPAVDDLTWRLGIDPARTAVVPDAVAVRTNDAERDSTVIAAAGPLDRSSRHDLVIRAVAALPPDLAGSVTLRIVGQGPLRPDLERLATSHTVKLEILDDGRWPTLTNTVDSCGLFVHAAMGDARPRELLEAMAAGCGIVAAESGDPLPIEHGATGLRASPTPEALAYTIAGMLTDPDWLGTLGTAARTWVRRECGLSSVGESLGAAHALALGERDTAARARRAG